MISSDVYPESDEIECLYKISNAIDTTFDLKKSLYMVLSLIADCLGMKRGSISILNYHTGEIHIEVAHGITAIEKSRGRYKLGEGITGLVIKTGRSIAVPKIGNEPLFLNRTGARKEIDKSNISFICVPIKDGNNVIGALSVDHIFDESSPLEKKERMLSIISGLIAQKVVLLQKINRNKERLEEENLRLKKELNKKYRFNNIIANSRKMQEVFYLITQVSASDANVLLLGESGTGKELVANAIHYNSLRSHRPLVKVNCAALPVNLVEAELFGYEQGAFTGAIRQKRGKFELAHRGTVFLDEIDSLAIDSQGKLLRVLQEKELERLGGTKVVKVNIRLIAAASRDLAMLVEENRFRKDLFYRLNVYPIYLPPLREREADILLLADYFLKKYADKYGKDIKRISTPAIDAMVSYGWPGNVRELENCMERAVLLCDDKVIHSYHLPFTLQTAEETGTQQKKSLKKAVETFEKELIVDALKHSKGNMRRAAKALDTTERIFGYKVKKYNINPKLYL